VLARSKKREALKSVGGSWTGIDEKQVDDQPGE
jgi:hypothetical protein